ncbi:fucolectin-like isoform X2 [Gigantopelta aegis]|uniref:fucolectin-like isoform X2 n=1 Tax=Gigantopelta aegis TaxID=1735272 RepID=UPI001B88E669|nr:fucolectin-like isoform X2 [Gigantopelta aegis]
MDSRALVVYWMYFLNNIYVDCSTNLALRKPTRQSSTYSPTSFSYNSSLAVDGNTNTRFSARSCTNTHPGPNEWWQVDLRGYYTVLSVTLVNRGDRHGNNLRDFLIETYLEDSLEKEDSVPSVCVRYLGTVEQGATKSFECAPSTVGRFVKITHQGNGRPLSLCEVVVDGSEVSNVASMFHGSLGTMWTPATTVNGNFKTPMGCGTVCFNSATCLGFNHNRALQQCQLASPIGATTSVGAESWRAKKHLTKMDSSCW